MNASLPHAPRTLTPASGTAIWLCAFVSPTIYFLLLLMGARFRIDLSQTLVVSLLFLLPVAALLVCEWVVWSCARTTGRRIGWMVFTLLAMLLQCAILLVVLRVILVAATGYAQ